MDNTVYLLYSDMKDRIQEQLCALSDPNLNKDEVDYREVQELISILDYGLYIIKDGETFNEKSICLD